VANAKTFLAEQELLFIELEELLGRQSDQLAALIGVRPKTGVLRYIPADDPPSDFSIEPVEILVERALQNNLDLQAAEKDIAAARALANAAKWEALPSVDLVGSLGGAGLYGTPQDVIFGGDTLRLPPGLEGSYGDALSEAAKRDYPSWSVGVEVSIPIGFRSGLGEKDRLEAQVLSAQQNHIEISRLLEEQVRDTHRELSHGKARLKAAREGVEAAQEQVRIGLIEFQNGRSTAFELVRLGEDSAVAQRRYSGALVRTAKAAATMRQLTSDNQAATRTQ
jgi:outer membrane protein TolC